LRFNQIKLENCPRGSTKDIKLLKTLAAWPNKWKPQRYVRTHNPKRQRGRSETEAQKWAEKGNHRKSECGKKKKLEIEKQKPTGNLFEKSKGCPFFPSVSLESRVRCSFIDITLKF